MQVAAARVVSGHTAGGSLPGLGAPQALGAAADPLDPLRSFINGFVARIGSDGDLGSTWHSLQQGRQRLGHTPSPVAHVGDRSVTPGPPAHGG